MQRNPVVRTKSNLKIPVMIIKHIQTLANARLKIYVVSRAREMAQWLGTLAALLEDLSSMSPTHICSL